MFDDLTDSEIDTAPTTRQAVECDTGIAADDMYRMSRRYVDYLSTLAWHLDTHRVYQALLHRTCRALPGWSAEAVQPDEGYRVRAVRLRDTVGLRAVNGNRNLCAGVEKLRLSGTFEWLRFIHGNEFIAWRFREEVLAAILENGAYGLLDASVLPRLTSPTDYQIYCHVSLARRMRKPRFVLPVQKAGIWVGWQDARWSDISGGVIRALRISCGHYGLTACLLLDRRGTLRGIDTAEVRLRHPGSLWSAKDMSKLNPETEKILVIDGSAHRTVRRNDFPAFVKRLRDARWRLSNLR